MLGMHLLPDTLQRRKENPTSGSLVAENDSIQIE
jgi:hypothetical protein